MSLHLLLNGIGMLSFLCSACAYLMTSMVRLRILAIASGSLGLIYNATLPSGPLWLVLFWLALFWIINATRLTNALRSEMEVALSPDDRALLVETFPMMHSRDWVALRAQAVITAFEEGETLLDLGADTNAVSVIARGEATEIRSTGEVFRRGPSAMWGELSYVTHQQFGGSPCRIVARRPVQVLAWDYAKLDALTSRNARMRAAMMEGFVRTAALKHGLMAADVDAPHAGTGGDALVMHRTALAAARGSIEDGVHQGHHGGLAASFQD